MLSDQRITSSALVAEHAPQGPTEEHLVEEVAGILWRKRRLRLSKYPDVWDEACIDLRADALLAAAKMIWPAPTAF